MPPSTPEAGTTTQSFNNTITTTQNFANCPRLSCRPSQLKVPDQFNHVEWAVTSTASKSHHRSRGLLMEDNQTIPRLGITIAAHIISPYHAQKFTSHHQLSLEHHHQQLETSRQNSVAARSKQNEFSGWCNFCVAIYRCSDSLSHCSREIELNA